MTFFFIPSCHCYKDSSFSSSSKLWSLKPKLRERWFFCTLKTNLRKFVGDWRRSDRHWSWKIFGSGGCATTNFQSRHIWFGSRTPDLRSLTSAYNEWLTLHHVENMCYPDLFFILFRLLLSHFFYFLSNLNGFYK